MNDALKKQALNRQKQAVLDKAASEACPVEASPMNQRLNIARELLQTNPQASLQAFIGALAVAKLDKSDTGVRKALRGCAAARERLGDLPGALSDMKLVLEMCTNQCVVFAHLCIESPHGRDSVTGAKARRWKWKRWGR